MNFIKKIFDNNIDGKVHLQFQKFSKGEFRDRALVRAKFSAGKISLWTSSEFANEFVYIVANKLKEAKSKITGCIISTSDLTGQLDFEDKKQFQGVKKYMINKEMSGNEIINLLEKFPKSFFALSFEAGKTKLKIKPKAPKSGKPGSKDKERPKPDFCTLKTDDKSIAEDFVFEKPNFKNADIGHNFIIEKIEVPEELRKSDDFAKVREESKRVGKIIREAIIDEEKLKSEKEFGA
ncbi:MAG: hypothetical protein KKF67_01480 [Nanoarchaeota archaeon]|nr:hypothetical protein [Nanoarchaeota archaeon]